MLEGKFPVPYFVLIRRMIIHPQWMFACVLFATTVIVMYNAIIILNAAVVDYFLRKTGIKIYKQTK